MNKNDKIFVCGHHGLVGSAMIRGLESAGYTNIITRTHSELDLTVQEDVREFFSREKPKFVILSAAKVGGIGANSSYPADFIMINIQIEMNVIDASFKNNVEKLLFLGSSCIYPKNCPQPIREEYLLTGALEKTNEAYALAKICGLKTCEFYNMQYKTNYISVMPCNLYGINDNFDYETSHVLPALIRKFHEAKVNNEKTVTVWGSGTPLREFLYVDDLAEACIFLMNNYNETSWVNVGAENEVSIAQLAKIIRDIVGFDGEIIFDSEKPDGTMRKKTDTSKLSSFGFKPKTSLETGIAKTYKWYLKNMCNK